LKGVDGRSQGGSCFNRGQSVVTTTDWQIMCRPISSIPAVRQLSAGKSGLAKRSSPGSPRGGGSWKTSRATVARGQRASWATYCTVEETSARDNAQAAEVSSQHAWCGGAGDCVRKRVGSSAQEAHIGVEEKEFRTRWGATRERVRRRSAFVWRRERSGHAGVCAGHTGR